MIAKKEFCRVCPLKAWGLVFFMAGLFFEMFVLIAAVAVAFVFFSFWKKKFLPMPFGIWLFVFN